jgi:hypothetical protein
MSSTIAENALAGRPRAAGAAPVPLYRLYLLRAGYALIAVGLALTAWPTVIHHTSAMAPASQVATSLLAGIGAMGVLGLRYPLQLLPLLIFELVWKAIYLIAFALPLWYAGKIDAATADNIKACLVVLIFIPLIPWRYVFARYVAQAGDRWN